MPVMSVAKLGCRIEETNRRPSLRSSEFVGSTALRDEIVFDLCEGLIDVSSALFNVSSKELRSTRRTPLNVSRVRQIAMYVAHVVLGLSMNEVGRGFGRDRTTVTHSCHLVEDMRDDVEFDRVVAMVERVVAAAFLNRLGTLR